MVEWTLYEGDCLEVMRELPDNSVDAIVTDPPYGLSREPDIEEVLRHWLAGDDYNHRGGGFMGKTWDSFVPGPAVWREVFRVVKPGGHILCFAGTRTVDLMGISLRLGGFEIRDCLQWLYGSGFPKSLDVSKAIDKTLGAERDKVRVPADKVRNPKSIRSGHGVDGGDRPWMQRAMELGYHEKDGNKPVTEAARKWHGWGTALKPAVEPIILARKPLSEATVADNVLKWGTGGLNVDGCLIAPREEADKAGFGHYSRNTSKPGALAGRVQNDNERREFTPTARAGRFPANILLDEEAAAMLDEQTGFGDSGGASRFFYVAKASKSERGENNLHPTVKPLKLMRYLVRLITPPGGTVLDPFAGSGTTLLAAEREGFDSVGIEMNPEYCEIIRRRMAGMQPVQAALL